MHWRLSGGLDKLELSAKKTIFLSFFFKTHFTLPGHRSGRWIRLQFLLGRLTLHYNSTSASILQRCRLGSGVVSLWMCAEPKYLAVFAFSTVVRSGTFIRSRRLLGIQRSLFLSITGACGITSLTSSVALLLLIPSLPDFLPSSYDSNGDPANPGWRFRMSRLVIFSPSVQSSYIPRSLLQRWSRSWPDPNMCRRFPEWTLHRIHFIIH